MSSDRRALVAAIRANPDDDTPRLVCADWFEEQGGESNATRAEFIRTQVKRAWLEPGDPRQSELEARELRLLRRHAADWCGSHFLFKKVRFRRGFIEYVHLHLQHFLHHRRQILDLEPIRDVSLTGWMRARDDLVRRVAACEEWNEIETLRLHNQGPHKWPRSNVVILIESPHLTRLKSLRLPSLELDAEARRRIERAPLLARLTELSLPLLNTYLSNPGPGPWLSEGGRDVAWANLQTLRINDGYLRPELITRLSEMPFWNRLRSLAVPLPYHQANDVLVRLRDRLPPSLEELRLVANHSPVQVPDAESFFERLSGVPLRALVLQWVPLTASALGRLLSAESRCELRALTLNGCRLTEQHAYVLANAPRMEQLESVHLHDYPSIPAVAAIQSKLGKNPHLELSIAGDGTGIGDLDQRDESVPIRSLALTVDRVSPRQVSHLLASLNLGHLARLSLDDREAALTVDRALAKQLAALPSLGYLKLMVGTVDDDARAILQGSESHLWTTLVTRDDPDSYPGDPNRIQPLDEDLAELDRGS
jgi:uncharacterized protein (TIGR02996 family)